MNGTSNQDKSNVTGEPNIDRAENDIKPSNTCCGLMKKLMHQGYDAWLVYLDTEHPVMICISIVMGLTVVITGASASITNIKNKLNSISIIIND